MIRAVASVSLAVCSALVVAACGGSAPAAPSTTLAARPPSDLGGNGTINVGLDMSDTAMVRLDPSTLEPFGIADDLERRLAQQTRLTPNTIRYASTSLILQGLARNEWDIAFLPVAEVRSAGGQVSAPIAEVEQTYLVLGTSPIHTVADVDAPGHHIAVETDSPAGVTLAGMLKAATLVKADTETAALNMLENGTADVMAGSRASLAILAAGLPGSRVLTGSFATVPYGIATPPSRSDALTYINAFAAAAAATVKASIARDALHGVSPG